MYYEVVLPSGKVVSVWTILPGNSILPRRRTQRSIRFSRPSIGHWRKRAITPINQIVGYILSEDPTYITNHLDARRLIRKIDRYGLLADIVANYFDDTEEHVGGGAPAGQHQFERSDASL